MHNAKFKRKTKRFVSSMVAVAMATTMLPTIPAFAATGTTTYSYDGYTVDYTVANEWGNGQSVEVIITNTGDESILNWAFKYDTDGTINGIWNATILENQGDDYLIKNNGWNYEIAPNQSVTFGYTLSDDFSTPDLFELYSNRVDITDGYTASINVTEAWDNGINGEIVITNTSSDNALEAWMLTFDSNFIINNLWDGRLIESRDNHYVISSEMWTNPIPVGSSIVIGFSASIETEVTPEIKNYFLSEVEIEGLEIDWEDPTDTDGDGLPDVYEKNVYNTDHKNPDSDGDNLPDGYEVMTLRTNPALPDSDGNGITDDSEDFDTDGLSNYEEFVLGTNPHLDDSDEDYLKDGEEVNSYGTDPLNPDTDEDTILDSDEILLGIDPTNPDDGDMPVKQSISEDELRVNRYNEDFKISIELEASNNVKRFIKQGVSKYAGILSDNNAIIGTPINIEYNAGTIIGGTITFRLDDDFVSNAPKYYPELDLGIERYGVFCYDKEIGTMVPVYCEYDTENNCIYVDAKNMGNLILIDYESLMFDLGIEPKIETYAMPRTFSVMSDESTISDTSDIENEDDNQANEVTDYETATYEEIYNIIAGEEYSEEEAVEEEISTFSLRSAEPLTTVEKNTMRFVDLALIVDTTGSMGSQIRTIQKELAELIYMLREDNISLYVSIIDYRDITCDGVDSTKVNNNSGVAFYNSVDNITTAIESLRASGGGDTPETAIDGLGAAYNLNFRNSAAKYAFLITDANYKNNNNYGIADMEEMAKLLESKNISTSVITSSYYYNYYNGLTALTGGELISMYDDFCEDMYRIISSETPIANVVIANNIVSGYFDEELVKGGDCDTDGDTLTDSDEVDWEYVKKVYDNGEYELYTWKELCEKSHFWFINWADYVDGTSNPLFDSMSNIKVIPATSNPFSADTDNDYYPDNEDSDKLEANAMYIYDSGIDDDDYHNGNPIVEKTSDKYTDGKLIIDNNAGTAKYSFTRRPKEEANFILTPNGRSFYKFDYNNNYCNIEVSYTKWYKNWGEPIYVERQDDGTYLLEQGTEYIISIIGGGNSEFNFTVEQDNWVYAPNGCIQTVETYANTLNPYLATSRYFVSEGMLYATIADIVGTEQDLSDIDNIEKIMDNLGYDREQYIITGEDVGNVVMADAILVVSVYSLGGTIATEGVSAVIATKYSIAGAAGTIGSVVYDVIFTPNINLFNKFMGYLEKLDLEDTFENCQNITGEYNIYCSNCIDIGLQNMWDVWETAPYIRKLDGAANTYSTELIDFTYTEKLRNSFGWK